MNINDYNCMLPKKDPEPKTCFECKVEKEADEFYSKSNKCKDCAKEYGRKQKESVANR